MQAPGSGVVSFDIVHLPSTTTYWLPWKRNQTHGHTITILMESWLRLSNIGEKYSNTMDVVCHKRHSRKLLSLIKLLILTHLQQLSSSESLFVFLCCFSLFVRKVWLRVDCFAGYSLYFQVRHYICSYWTWINIYHWTLNNPH